MRRKDGKCKSMFLISGYKDFIYNTSVWVRSMVFDIFSVLSNIFLEYTYVKMAHHITEIPLIIE